MLLKYPDPYKPFDVYADASDYGIAVAIQQEGCPIAFYYQTLSPSQRNYTTTQKESLAIVRGLEAYRNILLGRRVRIHTDHKTITFMKTSSPRPQTLRWLFTISEYTPELHWIEGDTNIVADFLSRYPMAEELATYDVGNPYETFVIEDDEVYEFCPVDYGTIQMHVH